MRTQRLRWDKPLDFWTPATFLFLLPLDPQQKKKGEKIKTEEGGSKEGKKEKRSPKREPDPGPCSVLDVSEGGDDVTEPQWDFSYPLHVKSSQTTWQL